MDTSTDHYLSRYAESEVAYLDRDFQPCGHVLVIPAMNESSRLLDQLDALWAGGDGELVILVINRPSTANLDLRLPQALRTRYRALSGNGPLQWFCPGGHNLLLEVDRYSDGQCLSPRQGVGLARKIGCDIACRLIHEGKVASPWIFSSDADVSWPEHYFTAADPISGASALVYPFFHEGSEGAAALAIQLYEFSLHYYVLGLARAGSSYAHHSLGSALAADYRHYAQVRGFPRRRAGEDFYLLNKLAKTGPIVSANLTGVP